MIVLLSGGLDSTVALYWARLRSDTLMAITFDYGQRHYRELEAAQRVAKFAGVPHDIVTIPTLAKVSKSSLTDHYRQVTDASSTVTPLRNLWFLTAAACVAHAHGMNEIVVGACGADQNDYPDCREPFFAAAQQAIDIGLGGDKQFVVHRPLIRLSKTQTIQLACKFTGCFEALADTWTCYEAHPPRSGCGACPACLSRRAGFLETGVEDPIRKEDS